MYRNIVWCYIIVLTLLDISLNTKLSAQGKSHGNGVSVHESLMEGISLQEWSGSAGGEGARGAGGGGALSLAPRALAFGRCALAAAHALSVTITNTANEILHLASVAGTTPDFHASFFDSKTLAPQANTTFSVVYVGRREGPVAAHLYIHTSKGVHKYPVSAVGVASEWRVWPLVGLRVPLNATLEPLLTLYNPTDTTIQVHEVYSSGAWLGLALPGGGAAAPRAAWALPPHAARPLVRLALQLPPHQPPAPPAPLTAYIRIKGNMTGGGLVVGVEASAAPPGEFLSPLQLRLRTRGSNDPPDTVWVEAGSSAEAARALRAAAAGSCAAAPPAHAAPLPDPHHDKTQFNGVKTEVSGVAVTLLRDQLEPHQPLTRVARLTLDYAKMWAGYEASLANGSEAGNGSGGAEGAGAGGARGASGAYCAGWLALGRAALPYSLRLLPGSLALQPHEMHFVTCDAEEARRAQELRARNDFPEPLRVAHVEFPPEVLHLFHTESFAPLELAAGATRALCRLRLRDPGAGPAAPSLQARLTLHTNLSHYTLPLLLYEGIPRIEWEWPNSADGTLRLGALGTSHTRVVRARLHNDGPAPLCITRLAATLPPHASATFQLQDHPRNAGCVPSGGWARGVLTLVAGRTAGAAAGAAEVHTRHGTASARLTLTAHHGRLRVEPVHLPPAAPYVPSSALLVVENSMALRMGVLEVVPTPGQEDPALNFNAEGTGEVGAGRSVVGRLHYSAEAHCQPHCYAGLQLDTPEGEAWARRAAADEAALRLDAALQRARYALFQPRALNFTMLLDTTEVVQVPVAGSVRWAWPRVWAAPARAARAGLAGVGASVPLRVRAANPSTRPLLLQPCLAIHPLELGGEGEPGACVGCVWSAASFQLGEWRATRGGATAYRHPEGEGGEQSVPYLLLQPGAEVEFTVTFAPGEPADLAAYLYLRNNLTILERILVTGRGAHPTFELGGRRPNSSSAIVLEVSECGGAGGAGGAGQARRALVVRNTGRVPLRLRDWRLAGQPCQGRAFRLAPCTARSLQPGDEHTLQLHYAADWTRARAQATLSVRVGASLARFTLQGLASARLLAACAPPAQHAPFESELRALGLVLAVLALIGAAGLGAADAERALRRHRTAREAQPPRPPLDLRAIGRATPPPVVAPPPVRPAPPPPRRRRTARGRAGGAGDAAAERLAFSRWRAGAGAAARDDSRSSEDGSPELRASPPPAPQPPRGDAESSSPDSSPPPRDSYSSLSRRAEDEEGATSGEDSSSPGEGCAPPPHSPPAGPPPVHVPSRGSRQRREGAEARRSERKSAEGAAADTSSNGGGAGTAGGARPAPARPHPRKERAGRRRGERAASPAPRARSPSPRAAPPPPPHAPQPAVRWGATWSDVVSRGNAAGTSEGGGAHGAAAPLAPIGSDVRRRLGSHSLFYYGGAPAWPPAPPAHPAPAPHEETVSGGYRSLESLWGSSVEPLAPGAAWLWGGGAPPAPPAHPVRPPPGFSAPRSVRPYDPFQSLASIWTPAALDWRLDAHTPPPAPPAPTPPLADDKFDSPSN